MKIVQAIKKLNEPFVFNEKRISLREPLVLVFGNRYMLESEHIFDEVKDLFPYANIVFGTTSGEIIDDKVLDGTIVLTAIEFEKSSVVIKRSNNKI